MKRIIIHTLAIGTVLACCGCGGSASSKGKADAKADLAAGKFAIETAGMPTPWSPTYARLLRERHGIEIREVAGCIVDKETMQHMDAYNAVMEAEISHRFGADTLEKTADEARRITP